MVLANVDGIGTREITRLVVDLLAEPRPGFVSRCQRRKIKGDESERVNALSPTSPCKTVHLLSTICVLRRRQLRALVESAKKLLERFGFRCCLARLMTGAQDCHGGTIEIGSDVPLKKIGEGDKGEAILSRRRVAALI
jgi:hypothetical protein